MEIQRLLGSDIQMQFDECVRLPCSAEEAERAMRLSLRWAERSKIAFGEQPGRAVFGIVQGGADKDLRISSARTLVAMGFDGYAIGGLAVGEPQSVMLGMIETVIPHLPEDKPRYLMGVGAPDDLLQSLMRGIDMFDCVMPTRAGRHGMVFTRRGRLNLRNARFADDRASDRSVVVFVGRADLFARLLAPSRQVGRDPRNDGADGDQSRLLSGLDGGGAAGDRGRAPQRLCRRDPAGMDGRRGRRRLTAAIFSRNDRLQVVSKRRRKCKRRDASRRLASCLRPRVRVQVPSYLFLPERLFRARAGTMERFSSSHRLCGVRRQTFWQRPPFRTRHC